MKLYTVAEIAEKYKVSIYSIRELLRNGYFPNAYKDLKRGGGPWLIPKTDLKNFKPRKKGRPMRDNPTVLTVFSRDYHARKSLEKSHGFGDDDFLKIVRLEKEGLSAKEIADQLGIGQRPVKDILRRTAIKPHRIKKQKTKKQPKRIPKKILTKLYVEKKMLTADILEQLETNYASLYINLRHWGIPLRDKNAKTSAQQDEKLLRQLYIGEKRSVEEIAAKLNLTVPYIRRKLRQFGITK